MSYTNLTIFLPIDNMISKHLLLNDARRLASFNRNLYKKGFKTNFCRQAGTPRLGTIPELNKSFQLYWFMQGGDVSKIKDQRQYLK